MTPASHAGGLIDTVRPHAGRVPRPARGTGRCRSAPRARVSLAHATGCPRSPILGHSPRAASHPTRSRRGRLRPEDDDVEMPASAGDGCRHGRQAGTGPHLTSLHRRTPPDAAVHPPPITVTAALAPLARVRVRRRPAAPNRAGARRPPDVGGVPIAEHGDVGDQAQPASGLMVARHVSTSRVRLGAPR